ncbi:MAG: DoxX family protein [Acidimicrobiales bacterium]
MSGAEWAAVLRIALGLWWLESVRHKNFEAWTKRHAGITWAKSVAEKHPWSFVRRGFAAVVAPRPSLMTWVVLGAEFSLGLGLTLGLLTPVALIGSAVLSSIYFVLMITDDAEQGQNSMMFVIAVACLGLMAWQTWSLDAALGLF